MHALHLKRWTCCGPTGTQNSRRPPFWGICFTCAAMCSTPINMESVLSCGLDERSHLHIPKNPQVTTRGLEAECGCGAETIMLVCWEHPAGLSVCSLPSVERGARCGKPAMTSWALLPTRSWGARLHLQVVNLTSYCTDTSIIVIKGQSNYLDTDFPREECRTNWARCFCMCVPVCVSVGASIAWRGIRGCHE